MSKFYKYVLFYFFCSDFVFLLKKDLSELIPLILLKNFKYNILGLDNVGRLRLFKKQDYFILLNTDKGILKIDGFYLIGRTEELIKGKKIKPRGRL